MIQYTYFPNSANVDFGHLFFMVLARPLAQIGMKYEPFWIKKKCTKIYIDYYIINNSYSKIKVWSPQNYNLSKTCGHFFGFKKKDPLWYTRYVVWYGLVWKLPAQKFNVGSSEFWLSQSNFLLLASVDLKLGKSSIKSLVPHTKRLAAEDINCWQ